MRRSFTMRRTVAAIPSGWIEIRAAAAEDITISLDIVAYFHTAYVSITLPRSLIQDVSKSGLDLEVTAYPCTENEERAAADLTH